MILYSSNLSMLIENFYLYYVFKNALNVVSWVSSIINVYHNINLFDKLIQSRKHRNFESFLQANKCFFKSRL